MKIFITSLFLCLTANLFAQDDLYFVIENIDFYGNEFTKDHVLRKELDFAIGDTIYIKDIPQVKEINEKRLLSTALFTGALINIGDWDLEQKKATIDVHVRESWYWFPTPILETGDRNLNVWLLEGDKDFSRINYGIQLQNINLTGNGDMMKLKVQRGYNDKYELHYSYPYLGKKLGVRGQIFYGSNDEIAYQTLDNKLLFGSNADKDKMFVRRRAALGILYRHQVRSRHHLDLFYRHHTIADYVTDSLTLDYFPKGENNMKWFSLQYKWKYDHRIFNFYPEGGWYTSVEVIKDGLGILDNFDMLTINLELQKYFKHHKNLTSGFRLAAGAKFFDGQIPYIHNRALGYQNNLVRGYELYVVDGARWVLGKYSLRYKLFSDEINLGRMMLLNKLKKLPLYVYLRGNIEAGYVYDGEYAKDNPLNDDILYGFGPGVDIILYHSFMFSVEYNFNKEQESGFFLKSSFNF